MRAQSVLFCDFVMRATVENMAAQRLRSGQVITFQVISVFGTLMNTCTSFRVKFQLHLPVRRYTCWTNCVVNSDTEFSLWALRKSLVVLRMESDFLSPQLPTQLQLSLILSAFVAGSKRQADEPQRHQLQT